MTGHPFAQSEQGLPDGVLAQYPCIEAVDRIEVASNVDGDASLD